MLSAPLRLTAMTLRGIGPYLHGARLEIKPLTILCGENGSGKSTWLAVLQEFKTASKDPSFPMSSGRYANEEDSEDSVAWLPGAARVDVNQVLRNAGHGDGRRPWKLSPDELKAAIETLCQTEVGEHVTDAAFGNPGCVGFDLEVVQTLQISGIDCERTDFDKSCASLPERILWLGEIPAGMNLKLRRSMPSSPLQGRIELSFGSGAVLRLTDGPKGFRTFECSPVFFTESLPDNSGLATLGIVAASTDQHFLLDPHCPVAEPIVAEMLSNFLILFRELSREMLRGFFHIGALRRYLTQDGTRGSPLFFTHNLSDLSDDEKSRITLKEWEEDGEYRDDRDSFREAEALRLNERYVSMNGSLTQEQHAYWAYNLMRQPNIPRCGSIDNSFKSHDFRDGAARPIDDLHPALLTHILGMATLELQKAWQQSERNSRERNELGLQLLNHAIQSRNLFQRQFRPNVDRGNNELIEMLGALPEEQDERLSSSKVLSDDEIVRVNRLMLERIFNESGEIKCLHRTGYLFETFVSFWLKQLTDTPVKYGEFEGQPLDTTWERQAVDGCSHVCFPSGGLTDPERESRARGTNANADYEYKSTDGQAGTYHYDLESTIMPPTAAGSTSWHMMSTGFHQLAPIVVQAALMHQNEIMAVENPEAHLHPSLQIKVAEFLLHQATSGKILLIETHSDLIVRRVLRAIREEQISEGSVFKQSSVGINFTSLVSAPQGFKHAKIEELEVNENGQVHNWPAGFMDDDLKEADRWLQANFRRDTSIEDSDD